MNLNDLLVFTEVAERGSFTAAGGALGMPKSNVSRAVSRLEDALGVQLLERTTRSQSLTEIGEMYYEHCARIKEELASASTSIESLSETPIGKLRICASVTAGQNWLAQYLPEFVRRYPGIQVDLRLANRRVDLIEEGFDVVIRVGGSPDSNLVRKYLCSTELRLYAAPSYLDQSNADLTVPMDLAKHACLFMSAVTERTQWEFRKGEETELVNFKPTLSADDFHVVQQMALAGLGIAQLPDYMGDAHVEDGRLIPVLDSWTGRVVEINALVRSSRGVTPKIRAFLDYIGDACKTV